MTRNFTNELQAARDANDWEAHARIWEERRTASVEHDEQTISNDKPTLTRRLVRTAADQALQALCVAYREGAQYSAFISIAMKMDNAAARAVYQCDMAMIAANYHNAAYSAFPGIRG